ncbi:MAG: c-type cytochrome biogenesis protein CcmI [Pseudomonadota bacterium]
MTFWLIAGGLAVLSVWLLLQPALSKSPRALARRQSALAILEDQLAEVDRDRERSVLSGNDAAAAEVEIKRRMVTLGKESEKNASLRGRGLIVLTAILVPLAGTALYLQIGQPEVPSVPVADRTDERQRLAKVTEATARLRSQLESNPNSSTEGWMLLGQTYMRMGRFSDAAAAFAKVIDRPDARADALSRYGEALVAAERGTVTPKAAAAFERALTLDPRNPAAIFYQSLAREQAGDVEGAFQALKRRLDAEGAFAPWMPSFVDRANVLAARFGAAPLELASYRALPPDGPSAGPQPTPEQVEAAGRMPEEQRGAFIQSMVDRLAKRLETEPGDLDGWLRLANAYVVLGETDEARSAYLRAKELLSALADDDPRHGVVDKGLAMLGG